MCSTAAGLCRGIKQKQQAGGADEALAEPRAKLGALEEQLSGLEGQTREALLELLAEFDRRYSDLAETDRGHYTSFFATVSLAAPQLQCNVVLWCIVHAVLMKHHLTCDL